MSIRHVQLKDLGRIVTGKTPSTKRPDYYGGEMPFLTPSDDMTGKYVTTTARTLSCAGVHAVEKCLLPAGAVCMSCIGSDLGKCVVTRDSLVTNQQINSVIPDLSIVDRDYLYYSLLPLGKRLNVLAKTSTAVPIVNKSTFSQCTIDLPSLPIQKIIAAILNVFDAKIALNTRTNGYLEELALAMLREEVVGSFPYGVTTVGAFAKQMSNGATPSRKQPHYWNGGTIPWVKTGEVNNNIIFRTEEHITQEALEKTSVHLLPVDTVVMALYGRGTAGRVGLLKTRATTNQACTAMICSSSSRAFYLYLILQNMFKQIDSLTRGSVQQNLSKDIVADIQIPDITNDYLNDRGFGLIYSKIAEGERENLTLGELRDALLPKLMSGEIDVSNVMVPMKEGKS